MWPGSKGALDALDLNGSERLDIVLMQLVKLLRDGEVVRMSKRTGKAISLHDLLDEVRVDAARWFFNAKPDTQMEFDLGLAVREDSRKPHLLRGIRPRPDLLSAAGPGERRRGRAGDR